MPKRDLYLTAYDIAAQATRTRAFKTCKAHGMGGQKSVHECLLGGRERRDLEGTLNRLINPETDRVLLLRFAPGTEIDGLGQAVRPPEPPWFYIG